MSEVVFGENGGRRSEGAKASAAAGVGKGGDKAAPASSTTTTTAARVLRFEGGPAVHSLFDFLYADAGEALGGGGGLVSSAIGGGGGGNGGNGRAAAEGSRQQQQQRRRASEGGTIAAAGLSSVAAGGSGAALAAAAANNNRNSSSSFPSTADVPLLLAPGPFAGACLSSLALEAAPAARGRHRARLSSSSSSSSGSGSSSSSSQNDDPLPPWCVAAVADALAAAQNSAGGGLEAVLTVDARTAACRSDRNTRSSRPRRRLRVSSCCAATRPSGSRWSRSTRWDWADVP